MRLLRTQRIDVYLEPVCQASSATKPPPLSRAQRAHLRLPWEERLTRNGRPETAGQVTIQLFGVPERLATSLRKASG